jgi:hypothetical protein
VIFLNSWLQPTVSLAPFRRAGIKTGDILPHIAQNKVLCFVACADFIVQTAVFRLPFFELYHENF